MIVYGFCKTSRKKPEIVGDTTTQYAGAALPTPTHDEQARVEPATLAPCLFTETGRAEARA